MDMAEILRTSGFVWVMSNTTQVCNTYNIEVFMNNLSGYVIRSILSRIFR